jgi:hypothetical protein
MMKNQYVFIIDPQTGERKATYLIGVHGSPEEILQKAADEYPGDSPVEGDDELFNDLVGKNMLYIHGRCVERPPYVPALADVQAAKISELKTIRDAKEVEPIRTDKGLFDYDDKARDRIQAAIIALNAGGRIDWTLADNTNVTVTNLDLEDVVRAVAVRSNTLHVTYRQLKEQVMAAETNEEVEAIHWPED